MRYIDQFVQPESFEEGTWLFELGESLEDAARNCQFPFRLDRSS